MSIAQLSPNSVNASSMSVNPQVKADQAATVPQVSQEADKTIQAAKTDTVAISPQALQKLVSDGDTNAQEVKESGAEKATETFKTIA
ncbi:MAG: hypothetical protein PHY09_12540 [Desulfuromonadaceae bacterium]|nr:hypothetical protein [Desulfuromonadaceae bacterium]MDD5107392.1 hypothetical protein [Desulfuromonadaceae bacterium]